MNSNAKTLATYDEYFQNYINGTVQVTSGFQKEWLDYLLSHCRTDAQILEIGAAFGRDAAYMTERGFTNLLATDAFDAAVTTLKTRGFRTEKLNVLQDELQGCYDLIIASAVFLHFTTDEFIGVLTKLKAALAEGGVLGFSVKHGLGEEWSDAKMDAPRFFRYWKEAELRQTLAMTGYKVMDFRHSEDGKWLHVTCAVESA